jgi:hypothetical protein
MFDPKAYGEEIQSILAAHEAGERLMPLAPRAPLRGDALTRLHGLSSRGLFTDTPVAAEDFADCARSALFLYLSDLDQSHTLSQNIPTATGSFLHGIMHRQEPDYSNSKYWFRRVGSHEIFSPLRASAIDVLAAKAGESPVASSLRAAIEGRGQWDPFWFVDQCEAAGGGNAGLDLPLREIQRIEWQLLFDYCYRKAVGRD